MDEITPPPTESPNRRADILIGSLALFHILINLFFFPIGSPVPGATEWLMKMLIGGVVAQPVLFAVWALIGPGMLMPRLLLTIVAFSAVLFAEFYGGLNYWDQPGYSHWQNAMFLAFPIGFFAVCATLMTLVRKLTGWRIVSRHDETQNVSSVRQFNVKFLLGFTALCAALLGAGRIATSSEWLGEQRADFIGQMLSGIGVLLLATFPALVVPVMALSNRSSPAVLLVLPFMWIGLTVLAAEAIVAMNPSEVRSQVLLDISQMQIGAALMGLISVAVLRLAGYSLVTLAPAPATSQTE